MDSNGDLQGTGLATFLVDGLMIEMPLFGAGQTAADNIAQIQFQLDLFNINRALVQDSTITGYESNMGLTDTIPVEALRGTDIQADDLGDRPEFYANFGTNLGFYADVKATSAGVQVRLSRGPLRTPPLSRGAIGLPVSTVS